MSIEQAQPLPSIGSIWSYRKHPERLYEVVLMANIAFRHPHHPPTVIYRAVTHPNHIYTRTVEAFATDFAPAPATTPPASANPMHYQERCANALREILMHGRPNLCRPEFDAAIAEARNALSAFDGVGRQWYAERWVSDPKWLYISGPNGVDCNVHPDEDIDYNDASRVLLALAHALLTEPDDTEAASC